MKDIVPSKHRNELIEKASKIKNRMGKTHKHDQNELEKISKNLLKNLRKTPANLTSTFITDQNIDCNLYGYALRTYIEINRASLSLRLAFKAEYTETNPDESVKINSNAVIKKIEELKCIRQLTSDDSYYFYLKYITNSLHDIVKLNSKSQVNIVDVTVIFLPYIELVNKSDRILPSHSILLYILQNSEKLFSNDSCQTEIKPKTKLLQRINSKI